jgi:CheY-like chemotaxis protein
VFAEVSDTGKGIPVDCQGRIFEPFFTTKGVGVGSGLGISICKNIVTGFGGKISFTSQIGKGTQFVVELPITPADWEAHPQTLPPAPNAPDFMPRGRILVVDDEPAICAAVRRLLKSRHDVVTAASAEACKVILERDQAFDLLFFDIMMPGTSGMELHQWLENINPALADQVVFVSGGAFTPNAAKYLQEAGNLQVEKPFDATSLKKLVGELVLAAKAKRRQ